ncbi:MAG: hypothetical protein NWQ45_00650, partial [Congregibacter sp.]|nr:hypothetical protein [Congregibacter sp.]
QRLLKIKHHDEAVNQLVELSAKDVELRGEVLHCELNARNEADIEASTHLTPTLAERAAQKAAQLAAVDDSDEPGESLEHSPEEPPASAAV